MTGKIHGHDLELTRKALDLISPGVGAAAGAVDQEKPLTPKRPSTSRADEGNGQAIDLNQLPRKGLRRLDRHAEVRLLRQEGEKAEQQLAANVREGESHGRVVLMS